MGLQIQTTGHLNVSLSERRTPQIPTPNQTRPHNLLYQWTAPNYGSTLTQLAHTTDEYPALNPDEDINAQQVVVTFCIMHAQFNRKCYPH